MLDAATGAVLASQTISSFDGDYVSFLISGNVDVRLTNLNPQGGGSTADVSAIFFGGRPRDVERQLRRDRHDDPGRLAQRLRR